MLTLEVPEMVPWESMEIALGRAGDISQVAISPPPLEMVIGVIAESLVKVTLFCEAVMLAIASLMVIEMDIELEPPELLAQM